MRIKEISENVQKWLHKHRYSIYLTAFALMCVAFTLGLLLAIANDVVRDTYALVNSAVDIVGMAFLLILFGCCLSGGYNMGKSSHYFDAMVFFAFLMTFCSSIGASMLGMPDKTATVYLFKGLRYAFSACFWFFLWQYHKTFFVCTRREGVLTAVLGVVLLLYAVDALTSFRTDHLFSVTADGYCRYNYENYLAIGVFALYFAIYAFYVLRSKTGMKFKISSLTFIAFPATVFLFTLIATPVFQGADLSSCENIALILPLFIIFSNLYNEQKNELIRQRAEYIEMQTAVMLSQIQPHFLFNVLATISGLCNIDGAVRSKEAVDRFSDYMRVNLDSIKKEKYVPFSRELEHIRNYVWLETMRFGERLKVEFDIGYEDFSLPSLTIQPLVENAIKHGVCKKENGGTVMISTRKVGKVILISVADDGVGFDPEEKKNDGRSHVGLENISIRLRQMCGGVLTIESEIGSGTVATVRIPEIGK